MSFIGGTAKAQTHYLLGYSAVDSGEIRWGGSTAYSSNWSTAISVWNALGGVNIAPDTLWTNDDLTISDVNKSDVIWTGQYTHTAIGADTIKFNSYYLGNDTTSQRTNTCLHELGHALGLAHSYSGDVMYDTQTSQTTLGSQDESDCNYLY